MRLVSTKFLTAMRRVSRARPAPLIARPGLATAPLISAPLLLGSPLNPIVVDDSPDSEPVPYALTSIPVTSCVADPTMETNSDFAAPSQGLFIDTDRFVHSASDQGRTLGHMACPGENSTSPSPQDFFTIIPISDCPDENSTENARVCLHNLRHVAKYHGFDLQKLHPEVFAPPIQSSTSLSVRDKIGPTAEQQAFLDNFDMANDVDRNDPDAVAMEEEIALLHEEIDRRLHASFSKKAPQPFSKNA